MADNTTLNTGTGGDVIATDDIAGVKFGRTKITLGADGVNDLDVSSANPMPVTGTITAVTSLTNALPAGTNTIGSVSTVPKTAGGLSTSKTISAASTNATSVKASAGQLYDLFVTNINAAVRYFKLYNKASAPTVGTDTPVLTFAIPGNTAGAGFSKHVPNGYEFTTGIAFALTTGVADADVGAVAANELVVNLGFK